MPAQEDRNNVDGTFYNAASFLTVPKTEWTISDMFTCQFNGRSENNVPTFVSLNFTQDECIGSSATGEEFNDTFNVSLIFKTTYFFFFF